MVRDLARFGDTAWPFTPLARDFYSPDQPRVPAGSPEGGQFQPKDGATAGSATLQKGGTFLKGSAFDEMFPGKSEADFEKMASDMVASSGIKFEVRIAPGKGDFGEPGVQLHFKEPGPTSDETTQWYGTFLISDDGEMVFDLGGIKVGDSKQGAGVARSLLKDIASTAQANGATAIQLHANIDVGAYAWARAGFVPYAKWNRVKDEVTERLVDLVDENKIPQSMADHLEASMKTGSKGIWDVADARYGGANIGFELLKGNNWYGRLKFSDGKAKARFDHYVNKAS